MFTIEEWEALPWWHRRVYIEGLNNEAEARGSSDGGSSGGSSGLTGMDAVLYGEADDLARSGFGT